MATKLQQETIEKNYIEEDIFTPSMYNVIMHNDNITTMEFVVEILETIFHMQKDEATKTMLLIHNIGMAICGVYSFEIAETKIDIVHKLAQKRNFPLKCTMKKI